MKYLCKESNCPSMPGWWWRRRGVSVSQSQRVPSSVPDAIIPPLGDQAQLINLDGMLTSAAARQGSWLRSQIVISSSPPAHERYVLSGENASQETPQGLAVHSWHTSPSLFHRMMVPSVDPVAVHSLLGELTRALTFPSWPQIATKNQVSRAVQC